MEVTDETDFEAAAQYDTKQWLLDQEDLLEATEEIDPSTPEVILMQQLKEDFVFPKPTQTDPQGRVFIFESEVIPQNFTSILNNLLHHINDDSLTVHSDQTSERKEDGKLDEELEHDLRMITNLLKLSGSIKIELIPGSENYIDKK